MIKWDGHTHTEFCPHGSLDKTVERIDKAIQLGFTHYSLTEHAPLPDVSFIDPQLRGECGMTLEKTVEYFTFIKELKRIYSDKITLYAALEIDFLSNHVAFTKDLVKQFQNDLDEWIISIHFLEVNNKLICLDYSPQAFQQQLVEVFGSVDKVHYAYWDCVEQLLTQDFSFFPPHRIAHLAIIRKFIRKSPLESTVFDSPDFYQAIMKKIRSKGYALDLDMAGLAQATCKEAYLTKPMLHWCKKYKIDLVYGSDAHKIKSIGQYYDTAKTWL